MSQQPRLTPAEMYEQYWGPAIFQPWAEVLLEYAQPKIGEHVLDLACGTGIVARLVAPRVGPQGRVVALDVNPVMLDGGRAIPPPQGAPVEWRLCNAMQLDLPDRSFDLVVCQQGMQFVPDRAAAVREVRRVLKPGGRFVLATWKSIQDHPLYQAQAEVEARYLEPLGVDGEDLIAPFSLNDPGELTRLLEEAGFTSIQVYSHSQDAVFTAPEKFVENSEYAYAAVIPQFVENPSAFEAFVQAVKQELAPVLAEYQAGETIVFPMHAFITTAR
jgi:ubiquinone/menaquinone biosynthesis C-methylase UbiE